MVLSKRERVIRTLELEEPDMVPIHHLGFEWTGSSNQYFIKSEEYKNIRAGIENEVLKMKFKVLMGITGSIVELRFWNADLHSLDPWGIDKFKMKPVKAPPEFPECVMLPYDGRIWKIAPQINTGLMYLWYENGYFRTPEIVHDKSDKSSGKIGYSFSRFDFRKRYSFFKSRKILQSRGSPGKKFECSRMSV